MDDKGSKYYYSRLADNERISITVYARHFCALNLRCLLAGRLLLICRRY